MNDFIKLLISLSCSGALLFLIILGVNRLCQSKFSKRWQYYIWLAAALRFILPFTPDTTIVGSLFAQIETIVTNDGLDAMHIADNASGNPHTAISDGQAIQNAPVKIRHGTGTASTLLPNDIKGSVVSYCIRFGYFYVFFIWFFTALFLFIRKIIVYRNFIRVLKNNNREVNDITLLNVLSDCTEKAHIKKPVALYYNQLIGSPIMIGFFHPAIIIPDKLTTDSALLAAQTEKFSYAFAHELVHYKRKDMFYKWFIQTITCIHWFNPVVYLLVKEIDRTCELACDEVILSDLDDTARKAYGDTLLSFVRTGNGYGNSLASVTLTEGAEQLKERLGAIMDMKNKNKKSKAVTVITILTTFIVAVCFIATGAYAAPARTLGQAETKILETEIPDTLEENKGYAYAYTQSGFYFDSYFIEMGWNVPESARMYYAATVLPIEDNKPVTVYFDDAVTKYMQDESAANAISALIAYLLNTNAAPKLETPLIHRIEYIAEKDIPAMAEKYYQENDYCGFSAIFSALDVTAQKEYFQEIYDTDQNALFSIVAQYMSIEEIAAYTKMAKQDGKNALFSILAEYMDADTIKQYAEECYEKDEIAEFSILVPYMTEDAAREWLKRARKDGKSTFKTVLVEEIEW